MNRREFFRNLLLGATAASLPLPIRAIATQLLAWEKRRAEVRAYQFAGLQQALKRIFSEPLTDNIVADSELLDIFESDMGATRVTENGGLYVQQAHYFELPRS